MAWIGNVYFRELAVLLPTFLVENTRNRETAELLLFILLQLGFYEDRCTDGYRHMPEQLQIQDKNTGFPCQS